MAQITFSKTPQELLQEWRRRNLINLDCHNRAERLYDRWNAVLLVLSIATLVALGAIAASVNLTEGLWKYLVILLTAAAAVSSVLLALRDYGGKAVSHRAAARQYAAICREIELTLLQPEARQRVALPAIAARWDWTAQAAPNVPQDLRQEGEEKWPALNAEHRPGTSF